VRYEFKLDDFSVTMSFSRRDEGKEPMRSERRASSSVQWKAVSTTEYCNERVNNEKGK